MLLKQSSDSKEIYPFSLFLKIANVCAQTLEKSLSYGLNNWPATEGGEQCRGKYITKGNFSENEFNTQMFDC